MSTTGPGGGDGNRRRPKPGAFFDEEPGTESGARPGPGRSGPVVPGSTGFDPGSSRAGRPARGDAQQAQIPTAPGGPPERPGSPQGPARPGGRATRPGGPPRGGAVPGGRVGPGGRNPGPGGPGAPAGPRGGSALRPRDPNEAATELVTQPGTDTGVVPAPALEQRRHASTFGQDDRDSELATKLGRHRDPRLEAADAPDEESIAGLTFDGVTPAQEVTTADLFKRISPPVQNREGRRSPDILRRAIDQFAPGNNPRYEPEPPERSRGHIFVWDLSKAMSCEVPHFLGSRALSLLQTCDWLRELGPTNGWRRVSLDRALEGASLGLPVLAMPKDLRTKMLAVLRPDPPDASGLPRVAALALEQGHDLSLQDALGTTQVDYYLHV